MKFIVNERFFDSTACQTYYEGRTYEAAGALLERLRGHIERHARVLPGEPEAGDGLEEKSRADLASIAEGLGLQVNANINKASLVAMIRGAGK